MSLKQFKEYCLIHNSNLDELYQDFMEEVQGDITYFENTHKVLTLSEASKDEDADNDTMGKLHEILFAAHVHGGVDEKGNIKRFPEDTRSAGKKAKDIHSALVKKIGGTSSDNYKKVNAAAKATAELWKSKHIPKGHTVEVSHWSSQAGDHERITGIKDTESKADVIIASKDKSGVIHHHPVSLKYTKSDPNLANNGLERISNESGIAKSEKSLADQWKDHMERTKEHHTGSGDERSSQYKVDAVARDAAAKGKDPLEAIKASHDKLVSKGQKEGGLNPKYQKRLAAHKQWLDSHNKEEDKGSFINKTIKRADEADKSKSEALQKIATTTANSYTLKGDAHIRGSLIKLSTPHTVLPHSVAVSYTKDDGTSKPFATSEHNFAKDHLDQFKNLVATQSGNGVVFYGDHHKTGKRTRVGTLNFKGGNGPYEGANSTLVLHNIMRDTMERQNTKEGSSREAKKDTKEAPISTSSKEPTGSAPVPTKQMTAVKPSSQSNEKIFSKRKPVVNTPTPVKREIPSELQKKKQPTTNMPYDYKSARNQDLGRKISSGDTEAEKELQRRQAKKKVA